LTSAQPLTRPSAGGRTGDSRVAVVGLGFAGLPTATAIAAAGFETIGVDIDVRKVAALNAGSSTSGVDASTIRPLLDAGWFSASSDPTVLAAVDVIVVSVPTPIDLEGRPDERALRGACATVLEHASDGALIVLQSTVVPGATRRLLVEPLERAGRLPGRDVFVAFSPERINPGDPVFHVSNTTKLVAGATPECLERAAAFVAGFVSSIGRVSSLEAAELAKLVENSFRFINISFVNELAVLCDRVGVSVWDVIDAAATKPFAFLAHRPGPGIGGDCIPVSPRYLEASALEHGLVSEIIPAGYRASDRMPDHVVDRCAAELGVDGRDLTGLRLVVVGVAYKPNVADTRHSPAVAVIHALRARGADVMIHDPLVSELEVEEVTYPSMPLDRPWPGGAKGADAAIVVTPHAAVDYEALVKSARLVLDTRNALGAIGRASIVPM
jgi:UDP-N-acetyl-D-glucosamine dehydrogenase